MSKRLPRGVKLKRLQERKKKTLLRAIRKLLGVKRIHRKRMPVGHNPFPIDISGVMI